MEVEGRVELGLARQQFLQPRLVLEGPLGLGLIVGESFVEPLQLATGNWSIGTFDFWRTTEGARECRDYRYCDFL